jgi:hypothetical protein
MFSRARDFRKPPFFSAATRGRRMNRDEALSRIPQLKIRAARDAIGC